MGVKIDLSRIPLVTNECYMPFYTDKNRYLVLMGGGSSGKSKFSAQKIVYRLLTMRNQRGLICRKVKETLRTSVYQEIITVIEEWGLKELFKIPKGHSSEMYIKCLNGNELIFFGLDNVEKRKSIKGITFIWIEEASELLEGDFNQLDLRLRDKVEGNYQQIMLSFNPILITHWLKKRFFDVNVKNATTSKTTYKDNRFLGQEQIDILEGYKDTDEYYYTVYCLGQWGTLGYSVFNSQNLQQRLTICEGFKPITGFFEYKKNEAERIVSHSFISVPQGEIKIYKEPQSGVPYVIGGDTAGDGSDYFAAHVINNITGEQVATYHRARVDEDYFAEQIYCLGLYYNNALISLEINFSTHPVKVLERLQYPKLYMREVGEDKIVSHIELRHGFRTDSINRPVMISELKELVRDNVHLLNDPKTIEEMLAFVRNEKGKPEASQGSHDDLVISLGITYHCRDRQSMRMIDRGQGSNISPLKKLAIKQRGK